MTLMELVKLVGLAIAVILAVLFYKSICRRREALLHSFVRLSVALIVYGFVSSIKLWSANLGLSRVIGFAAATLADSLIFAPRSRNIPESLRKEVIRRFEARTGQKYDASLHDIDHVVPHSKGGSTTVDNLRVIDRSANRSKKATTPWWDLLGHLQGDSESPLEVGREKLATGYERLWVNRLGRNNSTGQDSFDSPLPEENSRAGLVTETDVEHGWTEDDLRRLGLMK